MWRENKETAKRKESRKLDREPKKSGISTAKEEESFCYRKEENSCCIKGHSSSKKDRKASKKIDIGENQEESWSNKKCHNDDA